MEENTNEIKEEVKKEESPPKITSEVKTVRVKDPRRVAQGKKLALISREAKAKKAKGPYERKNRKNANKREIIPRRRRA